MARQAKTADDPLDRARVRRDFDDAVNMSPAELRDWLATNESKAAGWTHAGETETVGQDSGRRIVAICRKEKADPPMTISDTCARW